MALEGSLKEFGLADILQLLYFQRKTGVLVITGRQEEVRLLFNNGNVLSIDSKSRGDEKRVGRMLVKKGIIEPVTLKIALKEQKGLRLGAYLVRHGHADKDKVREVITQQITEAVVQLFSWKEGHYEFTAQGVPVDKDVEISIDTQHLLMEGLRLIDEWSVLKGRVTLETVLEKVAGTEAGLEPEESRILNFIDGESDLSTVTALSGMDALQASKAILGLMEKGVVAKKEAHAPEPVKQTAQRPALKKFGWLAPAAVAVGLCMAVFFAFTINAKIAGISASSDLDALRFSVEAIKYRDGSYPSSIARHDDPWGNPYVYKVHDGGFTLVSAGPDGIAGTADDIR